MTWLTTVILVSILFLLVLSIWEFSKNRKIRKEYQAKYEKALANYYEIIVESTEEDANE